MLETTRCGVAGCFARVRSTMTMCPPHWRLLPLDLQQAVMREASRHGEAATKAIRYVTAFKALRGTMSATDARHWLHGRMELLATLDGWARIQALLMGPTATGDTHEQRNTR